MVPWVWSLMTMSMLLMMSPWQWWRGFCVNLGRAEVNERVEKDHGGKNITGITLPQTNIAPENGWWED